jgi:hypothetical protein
VAKLLVESGASTEDETKAGLKTTDYRGYLLKIISIIKIGVQFWLCLMNYFQNSYLFFLCNSCKENINPVLHSRHFEGLNSAIMPTLWKTIPTCLKG